MVNLKEVPKEARKTVEEHMRAIYERRKDCLGVVTQIRDVVLPSIDRKPIVIRKVKINLPPNALSTLSAEDDAHMLFG
jgi:uncharacterized membrane protein